MEAVTMPFPAINDPPSEGARVAELGAISDQYHNRKCPAQLQTALDRDANGLFSSVLAMHGYPPATELINGMIKSIDPVITAHKEHFDQQRPHELADSWNIPFQSDIDEMETAQSPSYPSGHTTSAYYLAGRLSQLFPRAAGDLHRLAAMIAESRIDRGVHFPSDNEGGRQLAAALLAAE
jgi:membrane-associated phospholipid phosphatase